jgi:hypothetical protein
MWLDRLWQVLILLVATGLTVYFELDQKIKALFPSLASHIDEKTIIPIASGIIYVLLFFCKDVIARFGFIRRFTDEYYIYHGKYLSLPKHDPDALSILDIDTGFFDTKYYINGHSYSMAHESETGFWNSTLIKMTDEGHIEYTYSGHSIDPATHKQTFKGKGTANITLLGEYRDNGTGYWIDDDDKTLDRKHSTYVKLTPIIRRLIMGGEPVHRRFISGFVWRNKAIVKAFKAFPGNTKKPFVRPT